MFDLQDFVGGMFDGVSYSVAVGRGEQERLEYEHVERSLKHVTAGLGPGFLGRHIRMLPQDILVEQKNVNLWLMKLC